MRDGRSGETRLDDREQNFGLWIWDLVISKGVRRCDVQDKDQFPNNSDYRLLAQKTCSMITASLPGYNDE